MSNGYLNLINTEKPSSQTQPSSHDQIRQAQTYNDVLLRIHDLISNQKNQAMHKQIASYPYTSYRENNFSLAQDIEKNHKALKEMIELIDNRGASRHTHNENQSSKEVKRKSRLVERRREEKVDSWVVENDLIQVREELRKVIGLIDDKINKKQKHKFVFNDMYSQVDGKSKPDPKINNRQPQDVSRQDINGQNFVFIPRAGVQKVQSKSSLPRKPQSLSGQYLNLKQSFDRLNQTQPHRSMLFQSSIYHQKPQHRDSLLHNILPQSHILQKKCYVSAPKTINPQVPSLVIKQTTVPKVTFVHSTRPASALANNISFGLAPHPSAQVHYSKTPSPRWAHNRTSPVLPNRQYSPPPNSIQINQAGRANIFNQNHLKTRIVSQNGANDQLRKQTKSKTKFSFRDHLSKQQAESVKIHKEVPPVSINKVGLLDFPEPFQQQINLMENPFNFWSDKSEQEIKIQIRSVLHKDSLKSIPEMPEGNNQLSIIHQMVDDSKSLQSNSDKRLLHSLPRESLMMRSGQRGLKKKGIGLYQPTYQSYYYPNH